VPLRLSPYSVLGAAWFLLCGVVALWLLLGNAHGVVQSYRAANWPSTAGVVVFSEVATGCGRGSSNFPRVLFNYEVAGAKHRGSRLAFGSIGCGSWESAFSVVRLYKVGQEVPVYWNPAQADDSVLLVGEVLHDTWYAIAVSLTGVVGSFWLVFYYLRRGSAA
jgi:Protein of unknown function (DUF3592)